MSACRYRIMLDARAGDYLPFGAGRYVREIADRLPALVPDWKWYVLRVGDGGNETQGNVTTLFRKFTYSDYPVEQEELRRVGREVKPHLVHSLWYPLAESIQAIRVLTIHDAIAFKGHPEHIASDYIHNLPWFRRSCQLADHVITSSYVSLKDIFSTFSYPIERTSVIPLGYSDAFKHVSPQDVRRMRSQLQLPARYLFCSSHYTVSYKNLQVVREAIQILTQAGIQIPVLVGTGGTTGVVDRHFMKLPSLPDAELAAVLAGALFMVYPSLDEGFGLPVLEAMACRVPVICSRNGSLPEVGGDAVLYFNPEDPRDLASAIRLFLERRELREHFGAAGLQRASRFDWAETARRIVTVYRRLLEDNPALLGSAVRPAITWSRVRDARHLPGAARCRYPGELHAYGLALLAQKKSDKALAVFEAENRRYPHQPDTLRELGKLYKDTGAWNKAAGYFKAMLRIAQKEKLTDHLRSACYHLADCECRQGHYQPALALINQCLKISPDHRAAPLMKKEIVRHMQSSGPGREAARKRVK